MNLDDTEHLETNKKERKEHYNFYKELYKQSQN